MQDAALPNCLGGFGILPTEGEPLTFRYKWSVRCTAKFWDKAGEAFGSLSMIVSGDA